LFYIGFDLNLPQVEHAVEAPVEGDNDNDVHVDDEPQDNHGGNASLSDQGPRYLQFFVQFSSLTAGTVSLFFLQSI